jgi:hypothetical protein
MRLLQELDDARRLSNLLNFFEKFEQLVIFILTVLIAVFVIFAVWNLALVLQSIASSSSSMRTPEYAGEGFARQCNQASRVGQGKNASEK